MAVVVESEWLQRQNQVFSENIPLGIDVTAINAFGANRYREIDAALLPHRRLSQPFALCTLAFSSMALDAMGECIALSTGSTSVRLESPGRTDALLVWYDVQLADGILLSTGRLTLFYNLNQDRTPIYNHNCYFSTTWRARSTTWKGTESELDALYNQNPNYCNSRNQ